MQSRSAEGRIVAAIGRLFPKDSQPALIWRDLLDDAALTEQGEPQFVADAHSVIFAGVGAISLLLAIAVMAAVDSLWGHEAARRAGGLLLAPTAFFLTLAVVVQVAKLRGRFDGVQPLLGKLSWTACIGVVLAVALIFGRG